MSDLTILPADIDAMSVDQLAELPVEQLAALSVNQKAKFSRDIDQALDRLKKGRAKFDASLDSAYGERARAVRHDAGKDFGVIHLNDGSVRVSVDVPKRVTWDQKQLAAIAQRIAATGDRIEDYLVVEFSVPESRFNNWPTALREQFEPARTVKPGKATYALALVSED